MQSEKKEGFTMKKMFALLLAALLLFVSVSAFAENGEEIVPETPVFSLAGGWAYSESPEITEELQAIFDKAMEGFVGVHYAPVAYLGSQIVAGMNHCLLCQATVVYPGARPYYVLMYLYEALDGHVEILHIAELDIGALCVYGE